MRRDPTLGYIAPFLIYVGMMLLPLPPAWLYPIRFVLVTLVILVFSRPYLNLKPRFLLGSMAIGLAVFVIWIGPDLLFGYRHHWLFDNFLVRKAASSMPSSLRENFWFLSIRILSSVALVPVLEELFWRGWLMRWLIYKDFEKVPLGTYQPLSFALVALLFASEHGPYWDVGLLAGIIYNWWIVRTKSLADCILAHATTNAILCAYVLTAGQWQYWL